MIHYVVVVGKPDVLGSLAPRLPRAIDATAFFDGDRVESVAPGRPWLMAANAMPDALSPVRLVVDRDSMVVFNGHAVAVNGRQCDLATQLLETYRSTGSSGVVAALDGTYNFVGLDPARGLRAFSDFSGMFPLYWSTTGTYTVVSNRATTVRHLTDSTGWALEPMGWIIGHANLFGSQMPAQNVGAVRPGHELRAEWGTPSTDMRAATTVEWPAPTSDPGRPNLSPSEWDGVTESLVGRFSALHGLLGDLDIALTGGKDSRLCLALAKAAGLSGSLRTFTSGGRDTAEYRAAALVADAAGVEHGPPPRRTKRGPVTGGPPIECPRSTRPRQPGSDDVARTWQKLRRVVYRYEGTVTAWSGLQNSVGPVVEVKGWGGELYRRGNAKQFRRVEQLTVDELAERFVHYHQLHDPLGVLCEKTAEYQRQWMQAWVHENARHVRLDVLPEKFYVEHRLGHWSGPLLQFAPLRLAVNPLVDRYAAEKYLELSPAARACERFHFEVMQRAAPELVTVPFLDDAWATDPLVPEGVVGREPWPSRCPTGTMSHPASRARRRVSGPRATARAALRTLRRRNSRPRVVPRSANPGWRLLADDRPGIERLFRQARRRTDMGEICDMRHLIGLLQAGDPVDRSAEMKELFSCIGTALVLLGESEQVLDRPM